MRLSRDLALIAVGTLAATTASIAPAQAAPGWQTAVTFREARAQICTEVSADGSAVVRVRMNNRRGGDTYSAGISSVRARDGRPDRTLVNSRFVAPGDTGAPATYRKLTAADSFFVDITQRFEEGAGIVKTSAESFVVGEQKPC